MRSRKRQAKSRHTPYSNELGTQRAPRRSATRSAARNNNSNKTFDEYFETTPTTTRRNVSTTPRSTKARGKPNQRGSKQSPQLVYAPLELDNESSTDVPTHNDLPPPQCITPPITPEKVKEEDELQAGLPLAIEAPKESVIVDDADNDMVRDQGDNGADISVAQPELVLEQAPEMEKEKHDGLLKKLPTTPRLANFIPGNCNMEEVLKLYGTTPNIANATGHTTANQNNTK